MTIDAALWLFRGVSLFGCPEACVWRMTMRKLYALFRAYCCEHGVELHGSAKKDDVPISQLLGL